MAISWWLGRELLLFYRRYALLKLLPQIVKFDTVFLMKKHFKALGLAKQFVRNDQELLAFLVAMKKGNEFGAEGYPNLFSYVVAALRLCEAQAGKVLNPSRRSFPKWSWRFLPRRKHYSTK